jgi:glycogen debranching enzyme
VVARDACWFVYGCDHFLPNFSCHLLDALARRQMDSGKIIECYDAVTGKPEDYSLNINDNTPLFILAVNHHWRSTGHREETERLYPVVRRAAHYILSQEDDRGLVFCTATGQELHGIIGWRNIIPHYRISGAVTEVNAECAAALRAAGHLAENLGRPHQEAQEFLHAAEQLTAAINQYLLNPETGLYYLALDVDGSRRTEVTADEVFPVIFRVAPEEVAFRIISRLNYPDFWTEAGLRTTSQQSLDYNAYQQWGLLGGVWPGMTWWYAFAAARYHPEVMVKALHASFAHYARDPKKHNTVPGQFSEWFDGESLVNRGMRLSPWEAPRYLWAAVEGVCGLMLRSGEQHPQIHPLLPEEWRWVGVRRLPYHGHSFSFFAAREQGRFRLYGDRPINTRHHLEVYEEEVSDQVLVLNQHLEHLALRRAGEVTLCIGNTSRETTLSPVYLLDSLLDPERPYQLTIYNSERQAWGLGTSGPGHTLGSLAVTIEAQGFRILRFRERADAEVEETGS